ncbi:MAG: hypothetical protein FJ100_15690 [Deltaproteobacteria bacterium]|nr:hypothetical protein [Deltaproteobacteria bacterium]
MSRGRVEAEPPECAAAAPGSSPLLAYSPRFLAPLDAMADALHSPRTPVGSVDLANILRAVRHAQRRLWCNATWARAARVAVVPLGLAAAWVLATRLAWLDARFDPVGDTLVAVAAVTALGYAVAHQVPRLLAARALDRAGATHDALATAVWLLQTGRADGWAIAQARAAERIAAQVRPSAWIRLHRWPNGASAALAGTVVLVAAGLAPLDTPTAWVSAPRAADAAQLDLPAPPQGFVSARDVLGEDATSLLGADAALLREVEDQVPDPATRAWLRDLRHVIERVRDGSLDKREALEKLAALEAQKPAHPESAGAAAADPAPAPTVDPRQTAESERQRDLAARQAALDAAQQALDEAPKGPDKEQLQRAVDHGDLGLVAKLMEKLASKDLSAEEVKKWQKTLEKFADALKDRKAPKELEALAKKVERLQQQRQDQGGLGPQEQRRLQDARHQLDQLRKQVGDVQGAEHQLQRLERQARSAADEMRRAQEAQAEQKGARRDDAKQQAQRAQQALRQAAEELRRQDESQKSRQAQRIGQSRLRDVRDALGRSGQRPEQSGASQQRRSGRQNPQGDDDKPCEGDQAGQQGQESQPRSAADGRQPGRARRDQQGHNSGDNGGKAEAAAAEQQGEPSQGRVREREKAERPGFRLGSKGLGDKTRTELINEGYEQRAGKGGSRSGQRVHEGPGQGDGKGGPDQGKDPKLASARTEKLSGEKGDGPDTKRVFLDAARKGFARQGWRQTYREYSEVAEEMVDKESLPAGRKALVRRYFEKIRPR